jgi:hypothetical protein
MLKNNSQFFSLKKKTTKKIKIVKENIESSKFFILFFFEMKISKLLDYLTNMCKLKLPRYTIEDIVCFIHIKFSSWGGTLFAFFLFSFKGAIFIGPSPIFLGKMGHSPIEAPLFWDSSPPNRQKN